MSAKKLYADITGCSGVQSVSVESGYSTITATATVECTTTTLSLGDAISIDMGYADAHQNVFEGYVKKVVVSNPEGVYSITAQDVLIRAVDYFLVSDDPESPLTFHSTGDREVVDGLLGECGLSLTSGAVSPVFTLGTNEDGAKFNLQSVAESIQWMCSITGRVCYAESGLIYYVDRKPWVLGDDMLTGDWLSGTHILSCSKETDASRIRNRIVVYGNENLHAEASAASSYLVVDQSACIAHPLLDTQEICQATADVNLELLNRLAVTLNLELKGDAGIFPRQIYHVVEPFTDTLDDVFVYRVTHNMSQDGFVTSVVATI